MRIHRWTILAVVVCLLATTHSPPLRAEEGSDTDKTLYALGLAMSQRLAAMGFSEAEAARIAAGMTDGLLGREPGVDMNVYGPKIDTMLAARMSDLAERQKVAGTAYLEKAAAEPGAERTDSGVVYTEVAAGDGATPGPTDTVKLHYRGTLTDGTEFDSSIGGDPATFQVGGVIACFGEGVQRMRVGGKSTLVCPAGTAYGDRGAPPQIPPGATLIFEVELLEVVGSPASGE
jgi:FKBP-type peptidyl-prolyl cis-trans isomerase FkpA/FKBP-type peptidyl-prolyl cis-trans isomerase FklB